MSEMINTRTGEIVPVSRALAIAPNNVTDYLITQGIDPSTLPLDQPPAIYLNEVEGAMLALRFHGVHMEEVSDYGPAPVITFAGEAGFGVWSKSGAVDIVPGEEYSMHLFSQLLHDSFIDLAPEFNELIVIRYCGTRTSGTTGPKGEPLEYHSWVVVAPQRPIVSAEMTWDSIEKKGKKRGH